MVEIPEHLLQRSREAKAKAGGEEAPAPAAEAPTEEPAVGEPEAAPAAEPAPPETPVPDEPAPAAEAPAPVELAPAAAVAAPAVSAEPRRVYAPASQVSGTQEGYRGAKVPGWLYPAYVLIPLLLIGLILAMVQVSQEGEEAAGPTIPGATEYAAQCASCHGAEGGGGVGPAMKDVATVFPDPKEHFDWIKEVATKTSGPYGAGGAGNAGKGATPGAMPAFGSSLSDEEIWNVVIHERVTQAGEDPAKVFEAAGLPAPGGAAEAGAG